jgi:hypothetical protein
MSIESFYRSTFADSFLYFLLRKWSFFQHRTLQPSDLRFFSIYFDQDISSLCFPLSEYLFWREYVHLHDTSNSTYFVWTYGHTSSITDTLPKYRIIKHFFNITFRLPSATGLSDSRRDICGLERCSQQVTLDRSWSRAQALRERLQANWQTTDG